MSRFRILFVISVILNRFGVDKKNKFFDQLQTYNGLKIFFLKSALTYSPICPILPSVKQKRKYFTVFIVLLWLPFHHEVEREKPPFGKASQTQLIHTKIRSTFIFATLRYLLENFRRNLSRAPPNVYWDNLGGTIMHVMLWVNAGTFSENYTKQYLILNQLLESF